MNDVELLSKLNGAIDTAVTEGDWTLVRTLLDIRDRIPVRFDPSKVTSDELMTLLSGSLDILMPAVLQFVPEPQRAAALEAVTSRLACMPLTPGGGPQ